MFKKLYYFLFGISFGKKHASLISTFSKAAEEAKKLEQEMIRHIEIKKQKISKINKEIDEVDAVKTQTAKFSANITKLIGNEEVTSTDTSGSNAGSDKVG